MSIITENEQIVSQYINLCTDMPLMDLGVCDNSRSHIYAILGGSHIGSSFKDILGIGLILLSLEEGVLRSGQEIIESTSGSLGVGLGIGGKLLNHPITLVSDINIPYITKKKLELLDVNLILIDKPHPQLGFQYERMEKIKELIREKPEIYWMNQNNNPLNPMAYNRWLIPRIEKKIRDIDFNHAIFCVGSGGHFGAFARWIKDKHPICKIYAADRYGSITFGGKAGNSLIRGVGNQDIVPAVIQAHKKYVDEVTYVTDNEARLGCIELAKKGLFVGGSSGLAYMSAKKLITEKKVKGNVLTFFPDRGELYFDSLLKENIT